MSPSSIFRRGPLRFGLLIAFIILAAALARLADLPTGWILAVIAISWVLAALIERSAHRSARAAKAERAAGAAAPAPLRAWPQEEAAPDVAPPVAAPIEPPPPPPPPVRDGADADADLWLDGDAVIDPAPAPVVPWSKPPARVPEREPVVAARPDPPATAAPEPEPVPEPELVLPPLPLGVPSTALPRGSWNLWELEGIAREASGRNAAHDEERSLILMYLREFASAEGVLSPSFDDLVRESFGDLLPRR